MVDLRTPSGHLSRAFRGSPTMSTERTSVVPDEGPLTRWQKFRMLVKVVELRVRFLVLMAATGAVFGYWDTIVTRYEKWSRPVRETAAASPSIEFYCPM